MAKRKTKKVISLAVDPDLWDRVEALADAQSVSRSGFINRLLRDALDHEEDAIKAIQNPVIGPALLKAFGNRDVIKAMAEVVGENLTPAQLNQFREGVEHLTTPPKKLQGPTVRRKRSKKGV